MSSAHKALRGVRRTISKQVKGKFAFKFRFTVTYEYVDLQCNNKLKPSNVTVLWFRSHRSKTSKKPEVKAAYLDPNTGVFIYNAAWVPANSVELVVTLYKDGASSFRKKEYMFVIESHIPDADRKKLAIFSCDMAEFASPETNEFDLEMEFKPQSKKVILAKLGAKIKCELIKQGSPDEDDMESNFSHMSETEFKHRLTEFTDFSDDEDEPKPDAKKQKRKSWSKFIDDMKTLEYQEYHVAMVGNPLAEQHEDITSPDSPKSPDILNLKQEDVEEEEEEDPSSPPALSSDRRKKKTRVLSAVFEEEEDVQDSGGVVAHPSPIQEEKEANESLKFVFPDRKLTRAETLPDIHLATENSIAQGSNRIKKWMNDVNDKKQELQVRKLEVANKGLREGSKVLGQEIMQLHKEKDELQGEICELQMLVEDLRSKINELEISKVEVKKVKEPKEIQSKSEPQAKPQLENKLAQVRGWLCKRGVRGLTGKRWRRRWFATDQHCRLYYYKKNNNTQPRGFIDLDIIIAVQDKSEGDQDMNNALFDVIVPGRVYELMAHDEEEKMRWINALDYLRHWRSRMTNVDGVGNPSQPSHG